MKLSKLIAGVDVLSLHVRNADDLEIAGVSCDSRTICRGDIFVCIRGEHSDGADFIPDAILRGAALCVTTSPKAVPDGFPYIEVEHPRRALAQIWNNYYDHPADNLPVIAVTGTCGKTSVSFMLRHILRESGMLVGLMGTVRSMIGEGKIEDQEQSEVFKLPCAMTTPDPKYLYRNMRQMKDAGCDIVVMEASSHALSQHKLDPLRPKLSLFTNLTPEHLDYHRNMESYLRAKARLFELSERGILNGDDPSAEKIAALVPACPMTCVSTKEKSPYVVRNIRLCGMDGVSYTLKTPQGDLPIELPIPGSFSAENSALAACAALELGISPQIVRNALALMPCVEGRMEKIHSGDFTVIRDYAHTASALESVLKTVRRSTEGRLITVFGCGGDRDRSKRAPMGECATRLSDITVVTSDNSRTENPISIIEQILRGVHMDKFHTVIPNRREAIEYALSEARRGDTVILCGKGHENYEIDLRGKHPFDEREIVADFLKKFED